MTIQEIQTIRNVLLAYSELNLEDLIQKGFPDVTDFETTKINRLSIVDFFSTAQKVFQNINNKIEDNYWSSVLPYTIIALEYGNGNLNTHLQGFINSCQNNNFHQAENHLLALLNYQIILGFWKEDDKKNYLKEEDQKAFDKLKLIREEYENLKQVSHKIVANLEKQISSTEEFVAQKKAEIQQISQNLQTTNQHTNQISDLLNQSTDRNAKIESLLKENEKLNLDVQKAFDHIKETIEQQEGKFSDLVKKEEEQISQLQTKNADFTQKLEFVEGKKAFFQERNEYLTKLVGMEVGASLFESFKKRKDELDKPVSKWFWSVIVMTFISLICVLAIFTNIFGWLGPVNSTFSWEIIVINAIKSFPFIYLLYYSVSQYNKERNFQEEYAFKSAMALTVMAYVDLLKDDNNKDKLLTESVLRIYKAPIYNKLQQRSENTTAMEIAKDVVATGKEVVGIGKNITK